MKRLFLNCDERGGESKYFEPNDKKHLKKYKQ